MNSWPTTFTAFGAEASHPYHRQCAVECSAAGVGGLYGARGHGGLLDGWLVDPTDAGTTVDGATVRATPLWMTDEQATEAMVRAALEVAGV